MQAASDNRPDFESLKSLLLDMAQERSLDDLLRLTVDRLAEQPHVALARIWLIQPGDICPSCPMLEECPDQTSCLHLVASAGRPLAERGANWSGISGSFRRFPLGVRKVGHIGATGETVAVMDIEEDAQWIARPEWARQEGIRGFGGQPLVFKGEVIGVLAVFSRTPMVEEWLDWLRMIADHAASAIVNARAFQEIERLSNQLALENEYLREEVREAHAFGDLVGQSPALRNLLEQIELVAPTDASVLILGESGTGKELVAREIHKRSERRDQPMIRVNCPSVPKELYESEFFGHIKGAFTGALKDRAGRFEAANGGTMFLDEVGEIPLELQGKLLRVLQEGEYERVGEERTRRVDVRIIAATNRDLKVEVEAGRFRRDLYYRLNVFPIEVAPLSRRKEDIPLLTTHFLDLAATTLNMPRPRVTQANLLELQRYDWPGNVRELQNVIERAVITSRGGSLSFDLPEREDADRSPALAAIEAEASKGVEVVADAAMKRRERENIIAALELTGWKVYGPGGAAELLQIKPTTLASRMKAMGIRRTG
jgi:transcriptional regulator with GAF, ATPase, and Fis domain